MTNTMPRGELPAQYDLEYVAAEQIIDLLEVLDCYDCPGETDETIILQQEANRFIDDKYEFGNTAVLTACRLWAHLLAGSPDGENYVMSSRAHHFAYTVGQLLIPSVRLCIGNYYEAQNIDELSRRVCGDAVAFYETHPTLHNIVNTFASDMDPSYTHASLIETVSGITFKHMDDYNRLLHVI